MGGRRGQVALYVLAGVILVLLVGLSIFYVRQKRVETTVVAGQDDLLLNDPELAAEKARMQQRVDECLASVSAAALEEFSASGVPVESVAEAEGLIAEEISLGFPDCAFRFNTLDKVTISSEDDPKVSAAFAGGRLSVHASYPLEGALAGKTYPLSEFSASVPSALQSQIEGGIAMREAITGAATQAPNADALITEDGYVDLFAYEDQGVYADLEVNEDGSMVAYLYNYTGYAPGDSEPIPYVVALPPVPEGAQ